jgi:hypothetical protein
MAGLPGGPEDGRPAVRASDADRDHAVAELRERFAAGQLSQDTFVCRMEAALAARDHGELAGLLADLPTPRRPARPGLGARFAAAAAPVRHAVAGVMTGSARRVRWPMRPEPRPPGLIFPAGDRLRFTIGRDPECDLVLADLSVSRQHAGLHRGVRGWLLTDLGSTNGTRLNGWRVREPVPVSAGDRVSFGAVTFELRPGRKPVPLSRPVQGRPTGPDPVES